MSMEDFRSDRSRLLPSEFPGMVAIFATLRTQTRCRHDAYTGGPNRVSLTLYELYRTPPSVLAASFVMAFQ